VSARTFKWTVEIEVSESEVAGGINIDRPFSLHQAISRGWPYMRGDALTVKVIKSPSPESIATVQGAYKRLGWVYDAIGAAHVLISVNGAEGPGSVRLLCDSRKKHGSLNTAEPESTIHKCPECKRRDES
jgi:hypothetical protein